MTRKKNADSQPSAEEQALHQRVYEMMDLDRSKKPELVVEPTAEPVVQSVKVDPPSPEAEPEKEEQLVEPEPPVNSAEPAAKPIAIKAIDLDDKVTDKAIEEIVVSESDALLAAEDVAASLKTLPPSPKPKSTFRRLFKK